MSKSNFVIEFTDIAHDWWFKILILYFSVDKIKFWFRNDGISSPIINIQLRTE